MKEVAPDIFIENSFAPYNVGLIRIPDGSIVVDIPPQPEDAREWRRLAQEIGGVIRYAVLTDAQPERLVGAAQWDVPLIAAETAARHIATLDDKLWLELLDKMQNHQTKGNINPGGLKPRRPRLAVARQLRLYGALTLELETVAGAAPGSLWLYIPQRKVLFVGDCVAVETAPVLAHTLDLQAWLQAINALPQRKGVRIIVPGQGPTTFSDAVENQIEFIRVAQHTARRLMQETISGAGLAKATSDLQQAFFPAAPKHSLTTQHIRAGLERLIGDLQKIQESANL